MINISKECLHQILTEKVPILKHKDYKESLENALHVIEADMIIKRDIEKIKNERDTEESLYKSKIAGFSTAISLLQNQCTHLMTSFDPDPSGNNDSTTTCDICGKVL